MRIDTDKLVELCAVKGTEVRWVKHKGDYWVIVDGHAAIRVDQFVEFIADFKRETLGQITLPFLGEGESVMYDSMRCELREEKGINPMKGILERLPSKLHHVKLTDWALDAETEIFRGYQMKMFQLFPEPGVSELGLINRRFEFALWAAFVLEGSDVQAAIVGYDTQKNVCCLVMPIRLAEFECKITELKEILEMSD